MCVAVPMRVLSLDGNRATVGISGVLTAVDISLIDRVRAGDYLVVHAGFAISRWLPEEADEILKILGINEESDE